MFYLDLFGALQSADVKYVLVGGLAMNLHGVERSTMDIDLAIALDDANLQRAVTALRGQDLIPAIPAGWDDVVRPGQLDRWHDEKRMLALSLRKREGIAPSVDILTRPPVPFEQLFANRIVKDIAGVLVSLAGIDDLIALKRVAGRKIDLSDVEALELLKRMQARPE